VITLVDYGIGNLAAVQNMFRKIGVLCEVTSDLDKILKAEKLLLPGVGAFDAAMQRLTNTDLRRVLDEKVLIDKIPVIGICLGMQLLTRGSEEGSLPGLNWIEANTVRFPRSELKVPHMGWNNVVVSNSSRLTATFNHQHRFYFVHSYYVQVENENHSILKTTYGITFDSGIASDNIFGVQFHPEKSHGYGMHLLSNFAKI